MAASKFCDRCEESKPREQFNCGTCQHCDDCCSCLEEGIKEQEAEHFEHTDED